MNELNTNFETETLTFEDAFDYLVSIKELLSINYLSEKLKIHRTTLSTALNRTKNRYGNPNVLPKKHRQKIIDFVKIMQYTSLKENKGKCLSVIINEKLAG